MKCVRRKMCDEDDDNDVCVDAAVDDDGYDDDA